MLEHLVVVVGARIRFFSMLVLAIGAPTHEPV
jgi:hypothetical protein